MNPASRDALLAQLETVPAPPSFKDESSQGSDAGSNSDEEEEWADAPEEFHDPDTHPYARDDEIKDLIVQANALKVRGNDLFRESKWDDAFNTYLEGLHCLPPPRLRVPLGNDKGKGKAVSIDDDHEEDDGDTRSVHEDEDREIVLPSLPPSDIEQQCITLRSILHANIAACHVKLGDHKSAVASCTDSLLEVPTYTKALHRRATSNDALNTWTSLSAADKDYRQLLEILPPSSPLLRGIKASLETLGPRLERAQKAETDEMVGKLKDLGDSVLGRFGLSTNNFQFTPNGQGGYSMNFVK